MLSVFTIQRCLAISGNFGATHPGEFIARPISIISQPLKISTTMATSHAPFTPAEYLDQFQQRKPLSPNTELKGVCGRFIKGKNPEDFEILSNEPNKLLSWVCSPGMLGGLLGKTPSEALISVGMRKKWLLERLKDGTSFMLVVFPEKQGTIPTWDNLWPLIGEVYGQEVSTILEPFQDEIEALQKKVLKNPNPENDYHEIDPEGMIQYVKDLPVVEKHAHERFMSKARLLEIAEKAVTASGEKITIWHARAFLDHSVSCNAKFTGTGLSPDGDVEMLVRNVPLAEIEGCIKIPLDVRKEHFEEVEY